VFASERKAFEASNEVTAVHDCGESISLAVRDTCVMFSAPVHDIPGLRKRHTDNHILLIAYQ
jgi:hypothetical protein